MRPVFVGFLASESCSVALNLFPKLFPSSGLAHRGDCCSCWKGATYQGAILGFRVSSVASVIEDSVQTARSAARAGVMRLPSFAREPGQSSVLLLAFPSGTLVRSVFANLSDAG